jgi:hypothetical protein
VTDMVAESGDEVDLVAIDVSRSTSVGALRRCLALVFMLSAARWSKSCSKDVCLR